MIFVGCSRVRKLTDLLFNPPFPFKRIANLAKTQRLHERLLEDARLCTLEITSLPAPSDSPLVIFPTPTVDISSSETGTSTLTPQQTSRSANPTFVCTVSHTVTIHPLCTNSHSPQPHPPPRPPTVTHPPPQPHSMTSIYPPLSHPPSTTANPPLPQPHPLYHNVHGWHSNYGIHGYFDRRWQPRCPSMDCPWMAQ